LRGSEKLAGHSALPIQCNVLGGLPVYSKCRSEVSNDDTIDQENRTGTAWSFPWSADWEGPDDICERTNESSCISGKVVFRAASAIRAEWGIGATAGAFGSTCLWQVCIRCIVRGSTVTLCWRSAPLYTVRERGGPIANEGASTHDNTPRLRYSTSLLDNLNPLHATSASY
jgi:hypothetical protein